MDRIGYACRYCKEKYSTPPAVLPAYPAQSASPERQSLREPSLPLEAPSWEKVSLDSGGGVYAVSKSVECAVRRCWRKTGDMKGRICLTRQILLPPAARMHRHSGQLRQEPSISPVFSPTPSPQTERTLKLHTHPRRKPGSLFLSDLPQSPPALFPPSGLRFGDFFPVYGYLS